MRPIAVLAAAGLAASTAGQPFNTRFELQVSHDGVNWASSIAALPGDTIQVRAIATYIGPGTAAGLGQIVFQPVIESWRPGDTLLTTPGGPINGQGIGPVGGSRSTPIGVVPDAPGVWGRITPFGANSTSTTTFLRGHLGTGTAAGMIRIARADVTNWIGVGPTSGAGAANNTNGGGGVSAAQFASGARSPSDPAYNPETQNVPLFRFGFTIGPDPDVRSMRLWASLGSTGGGPIPPPPLPQNIRWFANLTEGTASLRGSAEQVDAFVHVVPAPPVLAFLAFAAVRRRRRANIP